MSLGNKAQAAANIARPLTIASGAVAVVDGSIDIYKGATTVQQVNELNRFARNDMQNKINAGQADNQAFTDYVNVHYRLKDAKDVAHFHEAIGAAKVASGGTMIASPFTGPAAPVVGAVGGVGYLGSSVYGTVYDHYHKAPLPVSVNAPLPRQPATPPAEAPAPLGALPKGGPKGGAEEAMKELPANLEIFAPMVYVAENRNSTTEAGYGSRRDQRSPSNTKASRTAATSPHVPVSYDRVSVGTTDLSLPTGCDSNAG